MLFHQRPFFIVKPARLQQYGIGYSDFSYIVQVSGYMHFLYFVVRKSQHFCKHRSRIADPPRMISSVRISRIKRRRYTLHKLVI